MDFHLEAVISFGIMHAVHTYSINLLHYDNNAAMMLIYYCITAP